MDSSFKLYQKKLKEAVTLVPQMDFNSQLAAVDFWNETSSELQKIIYRDDTGYEKSTIARRDVENFKTLQYMTDNCCINSTTNESSHGCSKVNNMNQTVVTTNIHTPHLSVVNSSSIVNQQSSTDKNYYKNTYQETSRLSDAQVGHSFENKQNSDSNAGKTTDNYAVNPNETFSCSFIRPQLNSRSPPLFQGHINPSNDTNQLYDTLRSCEIQGSATDEQVESSIVDIAADMWASEEYGASLSEPSNQSAGHPIQTNNLIASPRELDKLEQLIIGSGDEFNNVLNIDTSLSCQSQSNVNDTTSDSLKILENPVEYINYNASAQTMPLDQSSSIHTIQDQLSTQVHQPMDETQTFNLDHTNQIYSLLEMESGLFSCSKCDQQFVSLPELDHHEKLHMQEGDSSFSTSEIANTSSLEVKREVLLGGGDAGNMPNNSSQRSCSICHKSFSSAGNLKRHMRAHSGIKPYKCDHCESAFTEKKSLVIHLRRHTGERPYSCDICGRLFSQKGVLTSHRDRHLNERRFECTKCIKTFRQKSQLRLHLLRHDGVKRLECSTCKARFLTKADLNRHSQIHTGQRSFACEICEKMFTRKQSLKVHMNRHAGAKPFHSLENSHETESPNDKQIAS